MATQRPLRSIQIPVLQRQCLFQRPQYLHSPFAASISATRAFSSTPSRLAKRPIRQDKAQNRAHALSEVRPSPTVQYEKAQKEQPATEEDIGLLQNTMIRAPLREMWGRPLGVLTSYFWKLVKSKGVALYSRYHYRKCSQKTGWSRFLPVDAFNNAALKHRAQSLYKQLNTGIARGEIASLKPLCLPPLFRKLENRIAARPQDLSMTWELHKFKSTRVVSHRASPLGEDHPDTAYRQAVIRLESVQSLKRSSSDETTTMGSGSGRSVVTKGTRKLAWVPDAARKEQEKSRMVVQKQRDEDGVKAVKTHHAQGQSATRDLNKTVVEYLVLQQRVIDGKREEWKIWGFTEETTPERLVEDELYWRRTLAMQAA